MVETLGAETLGAETLGAEPYGAIASVSHIVGLVTLAQCLWQ